MTANARKPRFRKAARNVARKDYYTVGEAASLLGCGIKYTQDMCDKGELECFRLPSKGSSARGYPTKIPNMPHRRIQAVSLFARMREYGIPIPLHLQSDLNSIVFVGFPTSDVLRITKEAELPDCINIRIAANSFEAGYLAKENPPSAMIVDVAMVPEFRYWTPHVRKHVEVQNIVAVCGADHTITELKVKYNFTHVLQTPFSWKDLVPVLASRETHR